MKQKKKIRVRRPLERIELTLACLLIVCRLVLLLRTWNLATGFDWDSHLELLNAVSLRQLFVLPIFTYFYDYHPPIAFLAAKGFSTAFFIPAVAGAQVASTSMGITAFLFFRATLRRLGFLRTPQGVAFLYLTSVLPVTVFLSYAMNIDVFILAAASAVLYFSVRLVQDKRVSIGIVAGLGCALIFGMYSKMSGVVLFPLPFLLLVFLSVPGRRKAVVIAMSVAALWALSFSLPYYYTRYYEPTGQWLPSNTDRFDRDDQMRTRAMRDQNPVGFIAEMFKPARRYIPDAQSRDMAIPRLVDTWQDLWIKDSYVSARQRAKTTGLTDTLSMLYVWVMPFLVFGGVLLFLRERAIKLWKPFGLALFSYSCFLLLALIANVYRYPWGPSISNKVIYIAPVTWLVGFLLSQYWRGAREDRTGALYLVGIPLGILILLHTLLPVY